MANTTFKTSANSSSPIPRKQSEQRLRPFGHRPNIDLHAIDASSAPFFIPIHTPYTMPLPAAPDDPGGRAAYIQEHAPKASFFKQGTQAWHALRVVMWNASNVTSLLGLLFSHYNEMHSPVARLFGLQNQEMTKIDPLVGQWGLHNELNGTASMVSDFASVSQALSERCVINMSSNACAHEQGLLCALLPSALSRYNSWCPIRLTTIRS